jgi:hypothetical protein
MASNTEGWQMNSRAGFRMAAALASILLAVGLAVAPPAKAVVTEVPLPFTGTLSENWESFPNYLNTTGTYLSEPTTIMSGGAEISNDDAMAVYEPGGGAPFSMGSSGSAQVSDGVKGMAINSSADSDLLSSATTATITFTSSVTDFGGYWGAATFTDSGTQDPATVTLTFYDVLGGSDTVSFDYSRSSFDDDGDGEGDGVLEWHGWISTIPIKSLTYTGPSVVNDGLQATGVPAVPEPSSLLLLGSGLAGLGLWRRWHA